MLVSNFRGQPSVVDRIKMPTHIAVGDFGISPYLFWIEEEKHITAFGFVGFEIITAGVMPCNLVELGQHFGGTHILRPEGRRVSRTRD
jgi:hypothetical protein